MKVPKDVLMSSPIIEKEYSHKMSEENIQFISDLKFQSNNLCKNVHDVSLEDKTNVEDDEIFYLSRIFDEVEQPTLNFYIEPNSTIEDVQQNQVEEVEIIEMVLPIHIEEKKIVLEDDLIERVKLIEERIERQLGKGKSYFIIVCSQKSSSPQRMYKRRKLIKFGYFKVLRKIDEQDNKFEL